MIISGSEETREVSLDAESVTLGRSFDCDIVIEHSSISRNHARIYKDPFDRWIIEDLDSQNGIFVDGKRIKTHAVLPDQKFTIHPFTLSISQNYEQPIALDTLTYTDVLVVDKGPEEEVIPYDADRDSVLSAALIKHLNDLTGQLFELQSPSQLYSLVSGFLAQKLDALVSFIRLPRGSDKPVDSPQILTYYFGKASADQSVPPPACFHISKRVLNTVRSTNTLISAKSTPSVDELLVLTVVDELTPHLVIAAPITDSGDTVDVLYLDIVENKSPKGLFDFIEVIARQISSAQKSLTLSQSKTERQKLDQELVLARDIRSKLTQAEPGQDFEVDIAVSYKPAMWVGGDYHDVWALEDGRVAFAVGDVSGKGLPAAMVMSGLQVALRMAMNFCTELSTVAEHVNKHLCRSLQGQMSVTAFLGLFDPSTNKLSYVNAGHVPHLVMEPSSPAKPLTKATNTPLGVSACSYEMAEEILCPGAALVVVTDGVTEAESTDDGTFTMENLTVAMTNSKAASAGELVKAIVKSVTAFRKKAPQADDITVFALMNRKTTQS